MCVCFVGSFMLSTVQNYGVCASVSLLVFHDVKSSGVRQMPRQSFISSFENLGNSINMGPGVEVPTYIPENEPCGFITHLGYKHTGPSRRNS